ncbi:MAG: hypothetical protein KJ792_11965 [Actinobacteria bacterium]|nr:hypothetical protein [Actinomycetota bacterium]MCG2803117.1 hypothetical protein [Cellulomonas sp.]
MTIAFGAGWSLGAGRGETTDWQVATVSAEGDGATAAVGGATLPIGPSVPMWIDADGATRTAGRPTCLDALASAPGSFRVVVDHLTVDGKQVDAVVAIDCRVAH